jgi:hypothetical protein
MLELRKNDMGWREWLGMKPRIGDFASTLVMRFEREGMSGWTFDENDCALRHAQGGTINLANIYREYTQAARSNRQGLLQKYAAMSQALSRSIPTLWELAAKSIYPVVRLRFDISVTAIQMRAEKQEPPKPIVKWPWIGDLEIRLAYDWGQHLTQVQASLAETWGQSDESIRARALQNLAALPIPTWRELGGGVYELQTEYSYQESLLLVDKVIDLLAFKDSAVFIPSNRGVLLAADRNQQQSIVALFDLAITNQEAKPWPLSGVALERAGGEWREFQAEGEIGIRVGDLKRICTALTYNDQKSLLDALYKKTKTDIYVAAYNMARHERDGNAIRSWCSWAEGAKSSLPKTDLIIFGRGKPDANFVPVAVPWERAVSLAGHHMKDAGEEPPRYFVEGAFSDAEWAALVAEGRT